MKIFSATAITFLFVFLTIVNVLADETIYPDGYNIVSAYMISAQQFNVNDTVLISRTLVNNDDFDLANLYLEDNLPLEFSLVSSSVEVNNVTISAYFSGPIVGEVLPSFKVYRWAIDLPDSSDVYNHMLHPGDVLNLEYAVTCPLVGEYYLPFHTLACFGDTTGIFTTADSIPLTVTPGVGVPDDPLATPDRIFISVAYPNPFNSGVNIKLNGLVPAPGYVNFRVYDLLGNSVYDQKINANDDFISWYPGENVASGLYFYVIQSEMLQSSGKITLLK